MATSMLTKTPIQGSFHDLCVQWLQVRTYSKVFWKRYKELGEDQGEKYIKQIERGEQRIQRQQDIMDAIAAKMDRYRNPWQVLLCLTIPLPSFLSQSTAVQ